MKMNEFVTRAKLEEVIHSSGYGKAQSGGRMGASSGLSFSQRQSLDRRKAIVRRYEDSQLARQAFQRRGEILKGADYSLGKIQSRRTEREKLRFGDNRSLASSGRSGIENPRAQNSARFQSRGISEVSQSGIAGMYSTPSVSSQSSARSFYNISPKNGA